VHRHERHGEQGEVPVQAENGESGQARQPSLPVHQEAEDHHRGQQHEADDAGRAAGVPQRGAGRDTAHHDPPDVTWPLPEPDAGAELGELSPPDDELPDLACCALLAADPDDV
jgi:hypothetical protein